MIKFSEEGTIERALEESWYPGQKDPVSIYRWYSVDVRREFARNWDRMATYSKTKWLNKVRAAEKIIKSRMAEALLSDSPYVRLYANLLNTHRSRSKKK